MDPVLKDFLKGSMLLRYCSVTAFIWSEVPQRFTLPATSVAGGKKIFGIRLFFPLLETRGAAFLVGNFHQLLHFSCGSCADASSFVLTGAQCTWEIRRDRHLWWMSLAMLGLAFQVTTCIFKVWPDYSSTSSPNLIMMPTFVTLVSFCGWEPLQSMLRFCLKKTSECGHGMAHRHGQSNLVSRTSVKH